MSVLNDENTKNNNNPIIFVNSDKSVHVRDPEEVGCGMDSTNLSYFPEDCSYLFTNNTVLSVEFIQAAVNSPRWLEYRKYHCKLKTIQHR